MSKERDVLERISQILHIADELGENPYKTIGRLEYLVEEYFDSVALLDNGDITPSNE